ncbi:MAG: hypothetical protein GYA48_15235 [Chloroflexi bacterium]|nr:hypothetical protein [Chloroflexota bacterium]
MEKGFDEIKRMIRDFDVRVREVENREAACQPVVQQRLDAAWRKIDEHSTQIKEQDARLDAMNNLITKLEQANTLLVWLLGILGAAVIGWLVTQILKGIA